jgi:hypothetical protein
LYQEALKHPGGSMYKAEFRLKLTLPDGTVRERVFEHSDADLGNLATMFVEAIFSRGTVVAEGLFESVEQEEPALPTPPPPEPQENERSRRGKTRKRKDTADAPPAAEPGKSGGAAAPAVEHGAVAVPASAGETAADSPLHD